ncbi:MFS transporter [Dongia sp.]|uniref:MFS transporter n=1 Tax=Dongia sp. TaxID=1977262 RepID=UPI0035B4144A
MNKIPANQHAAPGRAEQNATRLSFSFIGVALATWAPLVPFAKMRAGLDEAGLGLLLLCLGAGSILAMPISGALATRFGCRAVILVSGATVCIALPLLAWQSIPMALAATLFVFGAAVGACEVAMNIQAVIVEKGAGRPLMSGLHGCFSIGGFAGAGSVSLCLSLGLTPLATTGFVTIALVMILLAADRRNLRYGNEGGARSPLFVMPRGIVLFIGLLCFICFLAEGAMLDWSAEFLISERSVPHTSSGSAYTAFAIAMTVGRFGGDRIVAALGRIRVMVLGGFLMAAGFSLAIWAPGMAGALFGFLCIGLGASNIVPVLYTATGAQSVMSPSHAVAAITTIGYSGILLGPAAIGFVAKASSLGTAFLLIAALILIVPLSAKLVAGRRRSETDAPA